jgi:hypothetical protein
MLHNQCIAMLEQTINIQPGQTGLGINLCYVTAPSNKEILKVPLVSALSQCALHCTVSRACVEAVQAGGITTIADMLFPMMNLDIEEEMCNKAGGFYVQCSIAAQCSAVQCTLGGSGRLCPCAPCC